MLFILLFLFIFIIFIILFTKHKTFISNILWHFKHCNCIVGGKKGTGKDLVFNFVINKRNEDYYGNISYGESNKRKFYLVESLSTISCDPNDYSHIVTNQIIKQEHKFIEGKDIYISDIGVFLPSYMDSKLYNLFPSMPVLYALSRHLYNNNIHCNTQNIERSWKALREQADFFIICKRTYKLFGFLFITKCISYDKYESARLNLMPLKSSLLNKFDKSMVKQYNATNGDIRKGWIIQFKRKLKYDTRAFEKILLKGDRLVSK